jgi:hypothetical protein
MLDAESGRFSIARTDVTLVSSVELVVLGASVARRRTATFGMEKPNRSAGPGAAARGRRRELAGLVALTKFAAAALSKQARRVLLSAMHGRRRARAVAELGVAFAARRGRRGGQQSAGAMQGHSGPSACDAAIPRLSCTGGETRRLLRNFARKQSVFQMQQHCHDLLPEPRFDCFVPASSQ